MTARVDAFLMHFGVKGMRWGVRKDRLPTEQTRNTANVDAFLGRSVGQALSTKGVLTKAEIESNEKRLTSLMAKSEKALQARLTPLVKQESKELADIELRYFKAANANKPGAREKYISELEKHDHKFDDLFDKANAGPSKEDAEIDALLGKMLTAETRADVYKRRLGIGLRGLALGTGVSLALHSDIDHTKVDNFLSHYGIKPKEVKDGSG